jgi:transposase
MTANTTARLQVFGGIDMSSEKFDIHLLETGQQAVFPNDTGGFHQFLNLLAPHEVLLIVVESTGSYENRLVEFLLTHGIPVARVNPLRTHCFMGGLAKRAKNDKIDARKLALYAKTVLPRISEIVSERKKRLDALVVRRLQVLEIKTGESNRKLITVDKKALKSIEKVLKLLDCQLKELDGEIRESIESDEETRRIDEIVQSMPGIGPISSAMLISQLPELGKANRQEVAALVGVAPFDDSSGKKNSPRHIGGGRKELRSTLFVAAWSVIKHNPALKAFYERLREDGTSGIASLIAVVRKMVTILNSMVHNNQLWEDKCVPKNS